MSLGGVTVPVNFQVGGDWERRLKQIESQSLQIGRALSGVGNAGGGAIGKLGQQLQARSEDLHKFRLGVEEVTEQLFVFGAQGSSLVNVIENVRDPLKRLELAQSALAGQTGRTGKFLTDLNQTFAVSHAKAAIAVGGVENLALVMGGAGLAAGALAGGLALLGGALVDLTTNAISKFIEGNKAATAQQEQLTKAVGRATTQYGELAYKVLEVDKVQKALVVTLGQTAGAFDRANDSGAGFLRLLSGAIVTVFPQYFPALLGLNDLLERNAALYDRAAQAQQGFNAGAGSRAAGFFTGAGQAGVGGVLSENQRQSQAAPGIARDARNTFGAPRAPTGGGQRRNISGLIGQASGRVGGAVALGGQRADERFNFTQQQETPFLVGDIRPAFDELARVVRGEQGPAAAQRRAAATADNPLVSDAQRAVEVWRTVTGVFNDAKGAAAGLAGSMADVAAAIGSGELKASQFGSALKSAFGEQLVTLGKGYVFQGAAMVLSGDPVGVPLAAAGLALATYGGTLSKKGGGGGGPSVGSAGAVSGAARAAGQGARTEQRQTTAVIRVGEREMQGTVSDLAGDGQRRGQTTQRGRR